MELHLDVDGGVAEYIEQTGLTEQLSSFLSQVRPDFRQVLTHFSLFCS
jgi:hypothetical protein